MGHGSKTDIEVVDYQGQEYEIRYDEGLVYSDTGKETIILSFDEIGYISNILSLSGCL